MTPYFNFNIRAVICTKSTSSYRSETRHDPRALDLIRFTVLKPSFNMEYRFVDARSDM